jgi:hypothetical protein
LSTTLTRIRRFSLSAYTQLSGITRPLSAGELEKRDEVGSFAHPLRSFSGWPIETRGDTPDPSGDRFQELGRWGYGGACKIICVTGYSANSVAKESSSYLETSTDVDNLLTFY